MKWAVILLFIVIQPSFAKQPSDAVVFSCLTARSISSDVKFKALETNEIAEMDNYKSGYKAVYYFENAGTDTGYAKNGNRRALIYDGNVFPIEKAFVLPNARLRFYDFNPYLADWSKVTDKSGQYLCVSFNFDGLGRSGSLQAERGGYLLAVPVSKYAKGLFFATGNVNLKK